MQKIESQALQSAAVWTQNRWTWFPTTVTAVPFATLYFWGVFEAFWASKLRNVLHYIQILQYPFLCPSTRKYGNNSHNKMPEFHSLEKAELNHKMLFTCLCEGSQRWKHFKQLKTVTEKKIQLCPVRGQWQECQEGFVNVFTSFCTVQCSRQAQSVLVFWFQKVSLSEI